MANKVLQGKVIRDVNDKTIIVSIETRKLNTLYKKYQKLERRYHVHDEQNSYKVGDKVKFISCRPISKMKKWKVFEEGSSND